MKEKLIIKNFGPIKSVDLDLGKITVLIGEQATGKSTIAKVLSMCRYFSYIIDNKNPLVYRSRFIEYGLAEWNLKGFENKNTFISYRNSDYSFQVKASLDVNNNLEFFTQTLIPKSDEFIKLLEKLKSFKVDKLINPNIEDIDTWDLPYNFLTTDVKKVMSNPFFIQTERVLQSIFSLGKSSIQNLSDSLFNQFALLDGIFKKFKSETVIEPLDLIYKNINGVAYFKGEKDKEFYKLSQGASGYQSAIPIVLAVKNYTEFEHRKRTFIVEEPEINLFPSTQKRLLQFFVENININKHSFLIPTHSPYFLSAINDLLLAHKRGQINEKETSDIIEKDFWLDSKDLSVYQLIDGKRLNVFNKETGLISDNIIDDVSDKMNEEFEKLLDIE
ncbi:MAG: AAA family ATPase [Winogradskyella sp.]